MNNMNNMNKEIQKVVYTVFQRYIRAVSKKYNIPVKELEQHLKPEWVPPTEGKKSNLNGKSLEYVICKQINDMYNIKCASADYDEYRQKYTLLPEKDQKNFEAGAMIVCKFLAKKDAKRLPIKTDLYADSKGKESLTADVVISYEDGTCTSLSIKNNKFTSKHQRPMAFMDRCGIDSADIVKYREEVDRIRGEFFGRFGHLGKFCDVNKESIVELYTGVNCVVMDYVNRLDKEQVQNMFHFLNSVDKQLYIVKNTKKEVSIYDCTNKILVPTRVVTSVNHLGYIVLEFNSKHRFSMRLHTASSRIERNLSLKYDTVLMNVDEMYPSEIIKK